MSRTTMKMGPPAIAGQIGPTVSLCHAVDAVAHNRFYRRNVKRSSSTSPKPFPTRDHRFVKALTPSPTPSPNLVTGQQRSMYVLDDRKSCQTLEGGRMRIHSTSECGGGQSKLVSATHLNGSLNILDIEESAINGDINPHKSNIDSTDSEKASAVIVEDSTLVHQVDGPALVNGFNHVDGDLHVIDQNRTSSSTCNIINECLGCDVEHTGMTDWSKTVDGQCRAPSTYDETETESLSLSVVRTRRHMQLSSDGSTIEKQLPGPEIGLPITVSLPQDEHVFDDTIRPLDIIPSLARRITRTISVKMVDPLPNQSPVKHLDVEDLDGEESRHRLDEEELSREEDSKDEEDALKEKKEIVEPNVIEISPGGRFMKFDQKIGIGSFKTVFKGQDTETGVHVAWCELHVSIQFDSVIEHKY